MHQKIEITKTINPSHMSKNKLLENLIKEAAIDGKVNCAVLRKIAEKADVTYKSAGKTTDKLKIKIKNCDFGCF